MFTWIQIDHIYKKIYVKHESLSSIRALLGDAAHGLFPIDYLHYVVLPGEADDTLIKDVIKAFEVDYPTEWMR